MMSAHKLMSLMLDELMGTGRNGENSQENTHFSNSRVCKSFLLGCCPHEVLSNTRFNLGECPKIHDLALKADFENSREHEYDFQLEAHQLLSNFMVECQRRTKVAKLRLAAAQDALNAQKAKQMECIQELDHKINTKIREAERLGAVGNVEEALKLMDEVDRLKQEKITITAHFKKTKPISHEQKKKLRICEVCSSYLGLEEGDKRLDDHVTGRLHLGFLYIKEKFKELQESIQEKCIRLALEKEFKIGAFKRPQACSLSPFQNSSEAVQSVSKKKQKTSSNIQQKRT